MPADAENHTIRLLQEMRRDMQANSATVQSLRDEMREGFYHVNTRIDGLTHILTLLAGNIAHHGERLDALEDEDRARARRSRETRHPGGRREVATARRGISALLLRRYICRHVQ
jgi:hypothetical protein